MSTPLPGPPDPPTAHMWGPAGPQGNPTDEARLDPLNELRDALDDAIRRAYCEPIAQPVEGEDPGQVRALAQAALIANPRRMRHLAGVQAAAWEAVQARIERVA